MGSYTTKQNGKSVTVQFTDGDVLRDVADLWAVVDGEYGGTPSTSSTALQQMMSDLQAGKPLDDMEWVLLKRLRSQYADKLAEFRASPDNALEGHVPASPAGSGRIGESLRLLPPSLRERLREAESTGSTGAMVALYPSPEVARSLAVKGGTAKDDLHLTLAFLGSASMITDADALRNAVGRWASTTPKFTGKISGTGQFTALAQPVTYASVDIPSLPSAREDLVGRLERAGCPPSIEHGFTPHVTLSDGTKNLKVDATPVTFDHVALKLGDERWDFPLTGLARDPMRLSALTLGLERMT